VAVDRPARPRNVGWEMRVMLSLFETPVSVASVMSGREGPEARGAVHGSTGPPTSPYSKMVASVPAPGSRPSHRTRDWLPTARSASLRPSTGLTPPRPVNVAVQVVLPGS